MSTNPDYRKNAATLSEHLIAEDGTAKAIKVIERVMANFVPGTSKKKKRRAKRKPLLSQTG
ncbi:hypothetical protein PSQ19_02215 [Devosia algicola]|uniref:Uncharacterized protein n=2 Tax=Devosia algicola TaxID=3026418 RepID=A0ABY7YPG8_9HYPH|nr:hypothetical protein PSQ19_02215 [Devosia algicola]